LQVISVKEDTRVRIKMSHSLKEIVVKDERVKTVLQAKESLDKKQLAEGSGKTLGDMLQAVNVTRSWGTVSMNAGEFTACNISRAFCHCLLPMFLVEAFLCLEHRLHPLIFYHDLFSANETFLYEPGCLLSRK